jgi:putative Mg2+ transporter-C (MgtC) family protein
MNKTASAFNIAFDASRTLECGEQAAQPSHMIDIHVMLHLLLAAGLGAAIGLEREYRQKPAGLRTNILIALGAAVFTTVSLSFAHGSGAPDRIASQIVSGVGFIGGGAILRSQVTVSGMTTAATIWVNAAIGMAAGAGESAIATTATLLTLVVLVVLPPIERYFDRRAGIPDHHDVRMHD